MPLVRSRGSRALRVGVLAAAVSACVIVGAPVATAQSSGPSAAALRAEADTLSSRYFGALERVQTLDADIEHNQQTIADLAGRAKKARADARGRALLAYTSSGSQLSALISGTDSVDSARRAQLIDRVNERDQTVYKKLHTATRELRKQQRVLRANRQAQADALSELRDQGAAIDAKLAQAEQQERAALAAAAIPAATPAPATTAGPGPAATTAPPPTSGAPASTTTTAPPPPAPVPPPNYTGTPGVNPHHDDPFLTCVRQRESGGNYSAVNPAGPYLGAYQFLQATWNVTASHAGRSALVGVPANLATPYDQDEMAWTLYQWQGTKPWGGPC